MYCPNCGLEIQGGTNFCPNCGTPIAPISAEPQPKPQPEPIPEPEPKPEPKPKAEPIQEGEKPNSMEKTLAIEAYLGILVLAPLFGAKKSKFAHFHVTQGFNLFLIGTAFYLLILFNSFIGGYCYYGAHWLYIILTIINVFYYLVEIAVTVFSIIGIINVIKNKMKALPLIGKIKIIK